MNVDVLATASIAIGLIVVLHQSLNSYGLQCNSCSGKADCQNLITSGLSGRCVIDLGKGKCFIRKDPNGAIYWGCIDDVFWPGVPWRNKNGCDVDRLRAWTQENGDVIPMIWCYCDVDDCNISIEKVNATYWNTADRVNTAPTAAALTPAAIRTAPAVTETTAAAITTFVNLTTPQMTATTSMTTPVPPPSDSCPQDFVVDLARRLCYKIVSPTESSRDLARDYDGAKRECQSLKGDLLSLLSTEQHVFVSSLLMEQPVLLDSWQGWWTSGQYDTAQFSWGRRTGKFLSLKSRLWGFKQLPLEKTCVWIMSIAIYNHSLANYDCGTKAGFICQLPL